MRDCYYNHWLLYRSIVYIDHLTKIYQKLEYLYSFELKTSCILILLRPLRYYNSLQYANVLHRYPYHQLLLKQ